ncbi:MAG: Asp-tRNA(Asn)/Glu-tRNA(Gln) amidotransferase subunit GatA [bacterium]
MNLTELDIKQVHSGLKSKTFSAVELTEAFLNRVKKHDKEIHAYLTLTEELALRQASRVDNKIKNKEKIGLLAGVPLSVKDIILVDGIRCAAGSKILEKYIAPYDATVIKRLKKEGAVIIGKTNLDEFAMGSSTENSAFGPTKNPHDLERVPGGSSGGSAAAVASDQCIYSLGSDTGGSIRQPASFCGVVGLKPTYGRVSRYGLMAFASSLDQIGCLTKTVGDAQIVLKAISGPDVNDSTSVVIIEDEQDKKKINQSKIKDLRIGVPKEYFVEGLDSEVEKEVKKALARYEEMGAKIIEVSLPHAEYALSSYYIIMSAEASSNLARYDGVKYGFSAKAENLLNNYLKTRQNGFGDEVRRRIMLGTYTLSAGYYDAYYLKAQKVRTLIKQDFDKVFEKVDVLMGPVSPTTAFKLGEKMTDPISMYLSDIYTVSINLAGLPAVSIPCNSSGLRNKGSKIKRLPIGLQIIGKQFEDEKILQIAKIYENSPA